MTDIAEAIRLFFFNIGLTWFTGDQFLMVLIGLGLVLLAALRRRPARLLLALGFGILVGNMPFPALEKDWLQSTGGYGMFSLFNFLLSPNLLPALVFLGIGAMTDFGPLLASPRLAILGAGAQIGILAAAFLGTLLSMSPGTAAVGAAAGGAHAPLAIYAAAALAPAGHLSVGAAVLAAFTCAALAPLIMPAVMRLLTTPAERAIVMAPPRPVSRRARILFPVVVFVIGVAFVPFARSVLALLLLGNLLRESAGDRIPKHYARAGAGLLLAVLAFGVGLVTRGENFLTLGTLAIFLFGLLGFALAAGWGILMVKVLNVFAKRKINPLLGAAGVTPAPVAARLVQRLAAEEDSGNHLLPHAQSASLAALIALALTIGVFIGMVG